LPNLNFYNKRGERFRFRVFLDDGMIPIVVILRMKMLKWMDVENVNYQPPSTSKSLHGEIPLWVKYQYLVHCAILMEGKI
jgi:hypothetical protein